MEQEKLVAAGGGMAPNAEARRICGLVRGWRCRHGLTQMQAAELLGVSIRAVTHWEAGTRLPGMLTLHRACQSEDLRVSTFARMLIDLRFPAYEDGRQTTEDGGRTRVREGNAGDPGGTVTAEGSWWS